MTEKDQTILHSNFNKRFKMHVDLEKYYMSEKWRKKRELVFRRCNGLCEGCLKEFATHVHHQSYLLFKQELLFELRGLCKKCHEKAHSIRSL